MTTTFPRFPWNIITSKQNRCITLYFNMYFNSQSCNCFCRLWKLEIYKTIIKGHWFENKSNPLESKRNAGLKYCNLLVWFFLCVSVVWFFSSWKCSVITTVCNTTLVIVFWKRERYLKKNGYALEPTLISEANTLCFEAFWWFQEFNSCCSADC